MTSWTPPRMQIMSRSVSLPVRPPAFAICYLPIFCLQSPAVSVLPSVAGSLCWLYLSLPLPSTELCMSVARTLPRRRRHCQYGLVAAPPPPPYRPSTPTHTTTHPSTHPSIHPYRHRNISHISHTRGRGRRGGLLSIFLSILHAFYLKNLYGF